MTMHFRLNQKITWGKLLLKLTVLPLKVTDFLIFISIIVFLLYINRLTDISINVLNESFYKVIFRKALTCFGCVFNQMRAINWALC